MSPTKSQLRIRLRHSDQIVTAMSEDIDKVLIGGIENHPIVLVSYDANWPDRFEKHAQRIRAALGAAVIQVEHIGSTAVPGLAAKPIVDILLVVQDSSFEPDYLPALEQAGYQLRVREPDWHEHRMLRTPDRDTQIHIFSTGCPEISRHLIFRDRLRENAADRDEYEQTKRALAGQEWTDTNAYSRAKTDVIERIIAAARLERSS